MIKDFLEVTLHKTEALWPLATHLTSYPNKMNKDTPVLEQPAKTYIDQICTATECSKDNLPKSSGQ